MRDSLVLAHAIPHTTARAAAPLWHQGFPRPTPGHWITLAVPHYRGGAVRWVLHVVLTAAR